MTSLTAHVVAAIAAGTPQNSTSTLNDVEPGLLGFLVVAGIGVALVFLLRSMNKQFRKLGPKPEDTLLTPADLAAMVRGENADSEALEQAPAGAVPGEVVQADEPRSR
ncbi:MAG TPA: hypothetical protein VH478_23945 [Trebonia sp.]|nr:hypothetical protein [Trebonia sp.]